MSSAGVKVDTEYISACCNCTYNCLELSQGFLVYGANHALAVYDLEECKTIETLVAHDGRVNCIRFVKAALESDQFLVSCCSKGKLILWEKGSSSGSLIAPTYTTKYVKVHEGLSLTVCDGIQISEKAYLIGCLTTDSRVQIYKLEGGDLTLLQEMDFKKSLALDLVFHMFPTESGKSTESVVLALGMDNGSVCLYSILQDGKKLEFHLSCTLLKHEDWVRCVSFVTLENGDVLLASGGQDSFIAVWRLTKSKSTKSDFEFQVHKFKDYLVIFDSMIIGHEGWINSLDWNLNDLISCSSDQSTIVWTCADDVWIEKSRFGVMGGQIPGGYGAKFLHDTVICYSFQGAIQIWRMEEETWKVQPSVTGHFGQVSDMDYDIAGHYIVTTSHDQTTRIHAPWGLGRWHEISRPQIHGHDIFSGRPMREMIVSGAEEKILRAFQPPDIFFKNLEDISDITINHKSSKTKAAAIPALGLSNQSEDTIVYENALELPVEVRLDEDFLRSQTLWPEVSKLYGHVYEISCIGTSPVDALVASGSQSSKSQFASIILWCARRWKNLGEFPFHKLNVTGLEFSPDGRKLLSVSRDRTWAVWKVEKNTIDENVQFSMQVQQSGSFHTRALWVGTWSPCATYFVTGARDKKLAVWKENPETSRYDVQATKVFQHPVSAAAVNLDNTIVVGLESGVIEILKYNEENGEAERLGVTGSLDQSNAHHDVIKRLRFNPKEKYQFASVGADHVLKIYQIKVTS